MKRICLTIILAGTLIFSVCGGDDDSVTPEDIKVIITPAETIINFGDSVRFSAEVFNTPNSAVSWHVNNIAGGNDSLGNIDTSGLYESPPLTNAFDRVTINAVSQVDTSKFDTAIVIILDPDFVFVDSAMGDDISGIGSVLHPFRTITKGIEEATMNQTVFVGEGTYYDGEEFPLTPGYKVTVQGKGTDLTRIQANSGTDTLDAAFLIRNNSSEVKDLAIVGTNYSGVGVHFSSDTVTTRLDFRNCKINGCYIGAIVTGPSLQVYFEDNEITNNSFGMKTTNGGFSYIRRCRFEGNDSVGVKVDSDAFAHLGENVGHGDNIFSDCGKWCVENAAYDSISAQYNTWPASDSATIDSFYIDGPVIFIPFN